MGMTSQKRWVSTCDEFVTTPIVLFSANRNRKKSSTPGSREGTSVCINSL
ncbi:hypothetical protein CP03DC35_0586 [Chlamydia psittaci 03DC35]|nr:hypothetical protein B600_0195 [Chlamydia psittaci VS225]EPJ14129.1 hypothetical protein CP02DC16_0593 [Chlamydia psittaci 02DC16]EPJ31608.1 hypothetical protein CP03DC35_0586 [Chlamydia psittaci 03DC35]